MSSPPVVWPIEPNNLCEVAQETARGRLDGKLFSRNGSLQLFPDTEHCPQQSRLIVHHRVWHETSSRYVSLCCWEGRLSGAAPPPLIAQRRKTTLRNEREIFRQISWSRH